MPRPTRTRTPTRTLSPAALVIPLLSAAATVLIACVRHGYDPCDGKAAGDACRMCDPSDSSCVETLEVKTCSASGRCSGRRETTAPVDRRNDGHAWLIDNRGGFCLSWMGVEDGPDGRLWLGAGGGLFHIDASDPESAFRIDAKAIERGAVTALRRGGESVYAVFGAEEVVEFTGSSRTTLGTGTSTPLAVSDNGCVAVTRGDELAVRLPGETDLRPVPLPRPANGFRLGVDAAIGLEGSLLVRTYRTADGPLGALYRVSCPSLDVTEVGRGDDFINLGRFAREDDGGLLAIDRYNGSGGAIRYRLMRSQDEGKTWTAVAVPEGFQSSVFAARGKWLVVAPPKLSAVLVSSDRGASWSLEPVDTYASVSESETMSVHVSDAGVVTIGANCNTLVHRRAPLP